MKKTAWSLLIIICLAIAELTAGYVGYLPVFAAEAPEAIELPEEAEIAAEAEIMEEPEEDLLLAGENGNEIFTVTLHANGEAGQIGYISKTEENGSWVYTETLELPCEEGTVCRLDDYTATAYDGMPYAFAGWVTDEGVSVSNITVNGNTDFYADWTDAGQITPDPGGTDPVSPGCYRVTYDANGGVFPLNNNSRTAYDDMYPDTIIGYSRFIPVHPRGMAFRGWSADPEGTVMIEPDTIVVQKAETFYAQWTDAGYTVTLHASRNDSDTNFRFGSSSSVFTTLSFKIAEGAVIGLEVPIPFCMDGSREWNCWEDGEGKQYVYPDINTLRPEKDMDLYMSWTGYVPVTVHANRDGQQYGIFRNYGHGQWGQEETRTTEEYIGTWYSMQPRDLGIVTLEGEHKAAAGWTYADGTPVPAEGFRLGDEPVDLYVNWVDAHIVRLHAGEDDGNSAFYFDDGVGGRYPVETVMIPVNEPIGQSIRWPERADEQMQMNGWKLPDGTILDDGELAQFIPDQDMDIRAVWKASWDAESECRVDLDANGGYFRYEGNEKEFFTIQRGEKILKTFYMRPEHTGRKTFLGWSEDRAGERMLVFPEEGIEITQDCTLYAQWTDGWEIRFDGNGRTFRNEFGTEMTVRSVIVPDGALLADYIPEFLVMGQDLAGWSADREGTQMVPMEETYALGDAVYYAQWKTGWLDTQYSDDTADPTWGSQIMDIRQDILSEADRKAEQLNSRTTVAVIDTGIRTAHALFKGRISEKSRSFIHTDIRDIEESDTAFGHGTAVAGIVAANTPPCVQLMILQAIDAGEENIGSIDRIVDALYYAVDQGADVINLSFGTSGNILENENTGDSIAKLQSALTYAERRGCLVVVSAGNEGADIAETGEIPAGLSDVVTVSAISENGSRSDFSNYGSAVDFCAPGENIYTAAGAAEEPDSMYRYFSGTSLAVPFIASAFAVAKIYQPQLTPAELRDLVKQYAFDPEKAGSSVPEEKRMQYGSGLPQVGSLTTEMAVSSDRIWLSVYAEQEGGCIKACLNWNTYPQVTYHIFRKYVTQPDTAFSEIGQVTVTSWFIEGYPYVDDLTDPALQCDAYEYYVEAELPEARRYYLRDTRSDTVTAYFPGLPAHVPETPAADWSDISCTMRGDTLYISGTGPVPDVSDSTPAPWESWSPEEREMIRRIVLEEGVTAVGFDAFRAFTELQSVMIPASLKQVRYGAFENCTAIPVVYCAGFPGDFNYEVEEANDAFIAAEKYYTAGGEQDGMAWTAEGYENELTLTVRSEGGVPDFQAVSDVPWFSERSQITDLILTDSADRIGNHSLYGFYSLRSVTLPAGIREYGADVFRNCPELDTFVFCPEDPLQTIRVSIPARSLEENGTDQTHPDLTVTVGDAPAPLQEGTDYEIRYPETAGSGRGMAEICFLGAYAEYDMVCLPVYVTQRWLGGENISALSAISVSPSVFTYDGSKKTPSVSVRSGKWYLRNGVDYRLVPADPGKTNAGTYSVRAVGIGAYKGTVTGSFRINKAQQPLVVKAAETIVTAGKITSVAVSGAMGAKSFSSSNSAVASVSGSGVITAKKAGTVTITIRSAGTSNYEAAVRTVSITVRNPVSKTPAQSGNTPGIIYRSHVQTYGWQGYASNGSLSGTTGESRRLEGIEISLVNLPCSGGVSYRAHVQTYGWQDEVADGKMAGTAGQAKRLEAIEIRLTGEAANRYDIYYRTHIQHFGWSGWAVNGDPCGSAGYGYRMEGIRICLVKKGAGAPGTTASAFYQRSGTDSVPEPEMKKTGAGVGYNAHVQTYGWQPYVYDGAAAGTEGRSKRLEGVHIALVDKPYSGDIVYRTHVQTYGWTDWKKNGELSGTTGEAKRLEAIEIRLTGEMARHFDVQYRVHVQTYGWSEYVKNGETAGTTGQSKRLEALQIALVPKE